MITGQKILTELGHKAWSGFNADDMVWENEESIIAKTELNGAIRYLFALSDFPFKENIQKLKTVSNKQNYNLSFGKISEIYLINNGNKVKLEYLTSDNLPVQTQKSAPTQYSIGVVETDLKLQLYPVPNGSYQLEIHYSKLEPVLDSEGNTKFEFEFADDYINMPDAIAYYFMDCLVLKTMEQNNKDEQDENYAPIINEFNQRWTEFKKLANPVKTETRIVWQ